MNPLSSSLALALAALLGGHAFAAAELERPIFAPVDRVIPVPPPGPNPLDAFEFRGVLTISGATYITLLDARSSRSLTIPLGSEIEGVSVSNFQAETGTVVATAGGATRTLTLHEAAIVAAAPAQGALNRSPNNPGFNFGTEIRIRREKRRQMLEAARSSTAGATTSPTPATR